MGRRMARIMVELSLMERRMARIRVYNLVSWGGGWPG
jgi:hypothetical protein